MRTTLDIDDDVLHHLRTIARLERKALGRVVSDLVRRNLAPATREIDEEKGFPVFRVPDDAPPITDELVRAALDES